MTNCPVGLKHTSLIMFVFMARDAGLWAIKQGSLYPATCNISLEYDVGDQFLYISTPSPKLH